MSATLQSAADALRSARATRQPIGRISESHGIAGLDAAYDVAAINTAFRVEGGARVVGKKVGLTSKAVQQQLGVDQPDFGVLFDDMEFLDGDDVPMARLIQPKAEAEIAFVVERDLAGSRPSYSEFVSALAYAVPALEIGLQLDIHGWTVSVGSGAACLGHPLRAAYWLAQVMGARGEGLKAGEVILSGALGPMAVVKAGDTIHARIGALGSVGCRMS